MKRFRIMYRTTSPICPVHNVDAPLTEATLTAEVHYCAVQFVLMTLQAQGMTREQACAELYKSDRMSAVREFLPSIDITEGSGLVPSANGSFKSGMN